MDPFVHEAAMHTGLDFRGDHGRTTISVKPKATPKVKVA